MPNYINRQSPWLAAAQAMQGVQSPIEQMMVQVPALRAKMQQEADMMGLRQGQLDVDVARVQGQQSVWESQARENNAKALAQEILNTLAPKAGQAKMQSYLNEQGFVPGVPTRQNAGIASEGDFLNALGQAIVLGQSPAATALRDEQQPIKLNMGQTAFDRSGIPTMQGAMNVPIGNTLMQGGQIGMPPNVLQQGQFTPSRIMDNPAASAANWAQVMKTYADVAPNALSTRQGTNYVTTPFANQLNQVIQMLAQRSGGTNMTPVAPTGVKIKSIKQIN